MPPTAPDEGAPEIENSGGTTPEQPPEEAERVVEPEVPGTVFLTLLLLMMIFGFWAMMYVILIDQ